MGRPRDSMLARRLRPVLFVLTVHVGADAVALD
jgi:hypothetical protein